MDFIITLHGEPIVRCATAKIQADVVGLLGMTYKSGLDWYVENSGKQERPLTRADIRAASDALAAAGWTPRRDG